MLGIFENLPDDLLQDIWFESHKSNSEPIMESIKSQKSKLEWTSYIITLTNALIYRSKVDNNDFNHIDYFIRFSFKARNICIYMWLKYFRILKLIFTKEVMLDLFVKLMSDGYVRAYMIKVLSDKTQKTFNKFIMYGQSKVVVCKVYHVPKDKSPLSYFCETFFYKNKYKGNAIRSWKKAFEVLWMEDI